MSASLAGLMPGPELAAAIAAWAAGPSGCAAHAVTGSEARAAGSAVHDRTAPAGTTAGDAVDALDVVVACERLGSWVAAQQMAAMMAVVAEDTSPVGGPGEFAAVEIGCALRLAPRTADQRLDTAWRIRTRCPATWSALAAGRISVPKAMAIAEETCHLDAGEVAGIEARVLDRAADWTPGQLRAAVRRAVLATDPAAARRRREKAAAAADVGVRPVEDGMAELTATMPAEDAAAVFAVVDEVARAADPTDPRPVGVRRVAALVDLLTGRGAHDRLTVVLNATITLTDLLPTHDISGPRRGAAGTPPARHGPGDPAGAPGAPRDTAEGASTTTGIAEVDKVGPVDLTALLRLAADHDLRLRRLLTCPDTGQLRHAGTSTYRIPATLDRHIRHRDRTCRFPGCRQPARRCDIDHQTLWPTGPTHPDNLAALCRHHHRLKTHTDWHVTHDPDTHALHWTSPTGRVYTTTSPPTAPGDDPPPTRAGPRQPTERPAGRPAPLRSSRSPTAAVPTPDPAGDPDPGAGAVPRVEERVTSAGWDTGTGPERQPDATEDPGARRRPADARAA